MANYVDISGCTSEETEEVLTQMENEKPTVERKTSAYIEQKHTEFAERYGLEFANELIEYYKPFAEKYGRELANAIFEDKVEIKKLAKLYGSKIEEYYSFPKLENSLINRMRLARDIDTEGGCYISHRSEGHRNGRYRYHYLVPKIEYVNTSKGLAKEVASWMELQLPKPITKKVGTLPVYRLFRGSTPAIDLVYLMRPFLVKEENIEKADNIIEMFEESAQIRCDESWNPIPRSEPKYIKAYKLRQEGYFPRKIAQRFGCSPRAVYNLIQYAKRQEYYRKYHREYNRKRVNAAQTPSI